MAAVPSIGRANRVEGVAPAEADLTRALYEEYANQIFRYCLHQLGSREEAEDAVQSTFLNAFRGIKRGVVPELESAWLFKIAHNVCLSRRRSSWRRGRIESPADFEVVEELTAAPARRADELIGLQDVLEQMPESQRRAILLREWQGLSYREIAEELELSQAAVETLIFRARRALASGLEQPPEKKRLARALDWGNIATAFKSLLLGGTAAAKVAATVAVVSATTVVAAAPVQEYRAHHKSTGTRTPARAAQTKQTAVERSIASSAVAPATHGARAAHAARKHAAAAPVSSTVVPASDATVAPETSVPAVTPPAAPAPAPPAAVPTTEAEATVGRSDDTPKQARDAAKDSGKHGKSDGAKGKGGNGGVDQPQPQPPVVTQPVTIPVQQVAAVQPPTPASETGGGPKSDHGSHKQQGGSNDFGGSVSSPPVTTQPVSPAVTSVAQSVAAQGGGKHEQERNLSGS